MEMTQEIFKVRNDIEADNLITEIKDLKADRTRFEMIYKAKVDQIKADFERQVLTIDKQVEFNTSMLQAYFSTVPVKSTKTQSTYKLLSGKLIMKHSSTKLAHDDTAILEWAKESGTEYIEFIPKLNWSRMKADLDIKGGMIVNKISGEVIECDGLKLEHIGERFEIKE